MRDAVATSRIDGLSAVGHLRKVRFRPKRLGTVGACQVNTQRGVPPSMKRAGRRPSSTLRVRGIEREHSRRGCPAPS